MSKNAYGFTISEIETVLGAVAEHEAILQHVSFERRALQETLGRIQELKAEQESHRAARQVATQKLNAEIAKSRGLVEALRDAARSKIGRRNERLVQFGVAPQRRRSGRKAAAPKPEGGGQT